MKKILATAAVLLSVISASGASCFGVSGFLTSSQALDMHRYAVMPDFCFQLFDTFAFGIQPGISESTSAAGRFPEDGPAKTKALILGAYGRFNVLHGKIVFVDIKGSAVMEHDKDLNYRKIRYGLQPALRLRMAPLLFLTADFGIWGITRENEFHEPVAKDIYADDFELGSISVGVQLAL